MNIDSLELKSCPRCWRPKYRKFLSALLAVGMLSTPGASLATQDAEIVIPTPVNDCAPYMPEPGASPAPGSSPASGAMPAVGPVGEPRLCWRAEFPSFVSTPELGAGLLFVSSADDQSHPTLFALDPETGTEVWRFEVGESLFATAPVYDEGSIFVGGPDGLYRLNAETGQRDWRFRVEPDANGFPQGFNYPTLAGNQVIGSSGAFAGGTLFAVDADTGDEVWSVPREGAGYLPATVTAKSVVAATYDGMLTAYDVATGDEVWSAELGGQPTSGPAALGTLILIAVGTSIRAFDAESGAESWTLETAEPVTGISGNDTIALLSGGGVLVAVNLDDGTSAWEVEVPASPLAGLTSPSVPVVVEDTVYVTGSDGLQASVMALSAADGEQRWMISSEELSFSAVTTPEIGGGRIYFGGFFMAGELVALGG